MFSEEKVELPSSGIAHLPSNQLVIHSPAIIVLNVSESTYAIKKMEEECGLVYDEAGIFHKILELISDETSASRRVRDYLHYQTYKNGGYGMCFEQREFLKCFHLLSRMVMWQIKLQGLYRHNRLPYMFDHLRSTNLVLRHLDSFYDQLRQDTANP